MQSLECSHPLRVEIPYPTNTYSSDVASKIVWIVRFFFLICCCALHELTDKIIWFWVPAPVVDLRRLVAKQKSKVRVWLLIIFHSWKSRCEKHSGLDCEYLGFHISRTETMFMISPPVCLWSAHGWPKVKGKTFIKHFFIGYQVEWQDIEWGPGVILAVVQAILPGVVPGVVLGVIPSVSAIVPDIVPGPRCYSSCCPSCCSSCNSQMLFQVLS